MEAQYYLNLFKALVRKLKAEGFEGISACSIALVFLQELSKDRRVEEMKADREKAKHEPATSRQIAYLKILGVKVEDGIDKQNAARMIEQRVRGY
jgi:uncharacterized tellurite resistance protein B-like protein